MDKPILTYEEQVTLFKQLFETGQALDLVPLPGQEGPSPCKEAAEEAFQSIDLDKLYKRAKLFGIQEKYPDFYDYLEQLQQNREEDISEAHEERLPEAPAETADADLEENDVPEPNETEESSLSEQVSKNLVEGEHTGNERDSEKYRKKDEYRERLNEEQRKNTEDSLKRRDEEQRKRIEEGQKHTPEPSNTESGPRTYVTNTNDVPPADSQNRYQQDSYESAGQRQAAPEERSSSAPETSTSQTEPSLVTEAKAQAESNYRTEPASGLSDIRNQGRADAADARVDKTETQASHRPEERTGETGGYQNRYQSDSYESAGQRQAAPEERNSLAPETSTSRTEPNRSAETPARTGSNYQTEPASGSSDIRNQGRTDAADVRVDGTGIPTATRPEERPESTGGHQNHYQSDSYESAGQRQAAPEERNSLAPETSTSQTEPSRVAEAPAQTGSNYQTEPAAGPSDTNGQEKAGTTDERPGERGTQTSNRAEGQPQGTGSYQNRYQNDSYESAGQRQAMPEERNSFVPEASTNRAEPNRTTEAPAKTGNNYQTEPASGPSNTKNQGHTDAADVRIDGAKTQADIRPEKRTKDADGYQNRYQSDSYESAGQRQAALEESNSLAPETSTSQAKPSRTTEAPAQTGNNYQTEPASGLSDIRNQGRTDAADTRVDGAETKAGHRQEERTGETGGYQNRYQSDSYESAGQRQAAPEERNSLAPETSTSRTEPNRTAEAPARTGSNYQTEPASGSSDIRNQGRTDAADVRVDGTGIPTTTRPEERPESTGGYQNHYQSDSYEAAGQRQAAPEERNSLAPETSTSQTEPSRVAEAPAQTGSNYQTEPAAGPSDTNGREKAGTTDERPGERGTQTSNRAEGQPQGTGSYQNRYQSDSYESAGQRQAAGPENGAQTENASYHTPSAPSPQETGHSIDAPTQNQERIDGSRPKETDLMQQQNKSTAAQIQGTYTPSADTTDNNSVITGTASSADTKEVQETANAVNNAKGSQYLTNKQVADSYSRTGQMDATTAAMTASQMQPWQGAGNAGNGTTQAASTTPGTSIAGTVSQSMNGSQPPQNAGVGLYGTRNGNLVSVNVNGHQKQFTVRSDGTVVINGTVAKVYKAGNGKVFVGWTGATQTRNTVTAPNGQAFSAAPNQQTVTSSSGVKFQTFSNVQATASQGQGIAFSVPSAFRNSGATARNFTQSGSGFTTNNFAKVVMPKSTKTLLKKGRIGKAILKQQRMLGVVLQAEVMSHVTRSLKAIGSSRIMVDKYDQILASMSADAAHMMKMNAFLEDKYLWKAVDLTALEQELTAKLAKFGLPQDMAELQKLIQSGALSGDQLTTAQKLLALNKERNTRNILAAKMEAARQTLALNGFSLKTEDLKAMLNNRSLSASDYKMIQSYLRLQQNTRGIIVNKGIMAVDKSKLSHLEQAFISASLPFSAGSAGLPTNIQAIKKLLKNGTLTKQQKDLAKALLRLNRALKLTNFSQALAMGVLGGVAKTAIHAVKTAPRKLKNLANRYMGNDYTMRGLMIITGLAGQIVGNTRKAYKVAKAAARVPRLAIKATTTTARATAAVGKAGLHTAKAGVRLGKNIAKNGIKKTAKNGVKRIAGATIKKFKKLGRGTFKKAGKGILKAMARILKIIATTLFSILGPMVLAIVVLFLIVFSIMSFISSSGDEVYYDAGDEDTELAMQEMVDLLTLCHSSFRAALSNQSEVNAGAERQQWINTLEDWAEEMVRVKAVYDNRGNKTPYTEALKQSPVKTNCALLVTHALQKAGIFNTNEKFYGSKDGTLKGSGVAHLRQIATITHYDNGTTYVKDLDLQPGDIVTYYIQHTNVYIGTNSSGQKEWIDAGRGTTVGGATGCSWNSFRTTNTCEAAVSNLIRLNFSTSVSDSSGGDAKQMKKGNTSKVQGLYDVTQGTWWNYEFTYQYIHGRWAAGTKQRQLDQMFDSGKLSISGNGNYAFVNNKMYMAAFGSYWGEVGDVLKVDFNTEVKIGSQPATKTLYIIKCDAKAWQHTGYPAEPEGIYGHHLGGHRDFAEFMGYGSQPEGLNGKGIVPVSCTNMGSILDGTFNENLIGTSSMIASSVKSDAEIFYRQEIDQETYRDIIDRENNIYYTFPEEQETPDGITPTPTPEGYDKDEDTGEVYAFYNNNQELISMVNAMFDFDVNTATSVKQTVISTMNQSGGDETAADNAVQRGETNKINDDTWKLIGFLQENGMDLTNYKEGGYDDLKYSTLVGLFNASHIITTTDVKQYHKGPDGTINPTWKNGRIVAQANTDGRAYQIPVIETTYEVIENPLGGFDYIPNTHIKLDENGNIVYETIYVPCPGHTKQSVAVITLHFDSLLNIQQWWQDNIYGVDDFDQENPDYSSEKKGDPNYRAKSTVLKQSVQIIKKPDFYKELNGTCSEGDSGDSSFSPGTMTESQQEVAKECYKYLTKTMQMTDEQAVGVLVNMLRESGFRYTAIEEDGGAGYGLCQWSFGRRTRLVSWCNAHPQDGPYSSISGQMSYLKAEFEIYTDVWAGDGVRGFWRCQTAREAGDYFLRYFEQPDAASVDQRSREMDSDIATVRKYLK